MSIGWSRQVVCAVWVVATMTLVGCQCEHESKPYNVTVSLDPSVTARSIPVIEVHLVGVNDAENAFWNNYSMNKYWGPNDKTRETAPKYVMTFGPNKPQSQTLNADNKIWQDWLSRGATRLYVLAFLPEKFDDAPGDTDPRRRVLPLDQCKWPKDLQAIKVTLLPSNVRVDTSPVNRK